MDHQSFWDSIPVVGAMIQRMNGGLRLVMVEVGKVLIISGVVGAITMYAAVKVIESKIQSLVDVAQRHEMEITSVRTRMIEVEVRLMESHTEHVHQYREIDKRLENHERQTDVIINHLNTNRRPR